MEERSLEEERYSEAERFWEVDLPYFQVPLGEGLREGDHEEQLLVDLLAEGRIQGDQLEDQILAVHRAVLWERLLAALPLEALL